TGDIGVHELAWARRRGHETGVGGPGAEETNRPTPDSGPHGLELWVVSTRFSCLCTLHPDYSFVPRWRPPFITALAAEDRCHLNGLGVVDGEPRYVTALGATNEKDGWRSGKATGGIVVDIPSGEVIARGLCM